MRVLVADPDKISRDAMCWLLRWHHMECSGAVDYQDAEERLAIGRWDVALIEFHFSELPRGLDLVVKAESLSIRAVVMSRTRDCQVKVDAKGLLFLAKPFSIAALLQAVGSETVQACGGRGV